MAGRYMDTTTGLLNSFKDSVLSQSKADKFSRKADDLCCDASWYVKKILPHVARLCLVSTFIEDTFRMITQFEDQREYVASLWKAGYVSTSIFIYTNMIGQFLGVCMVMYRKSIPYAAALLAGLIVMQTIGYNMWDLETLVRDTSLVGALLILVAESQEGARRSLMPGIPSLDNNNKPKTFLQLVGRIMLVLMFVSINAHEMMKYEWTLFHVTANLVGLVLVVLVAIGYKTRISISLFTAGLLILNFNMFPWWSTEYYEMKDYLKFYFFQTLTVIGGLLMVVVVGPGEISVDNYKKLN